MRPGRTLRRLVVLSVCCVLMSSCGAVRGERVVSGVSTQDAQSVEVTPVRQATGNTIEANSVSESGVFSFVSANLNGDDPISGVELVRDGPVIMTFVVPHCPVCVSEAPRLAQSAVENPNITYVMVHSGGTADDYRSFNEASGLVVANVVHVDDSAGRLWARFGVIQQPTNVFVDSDGNLSQSLGALSSEDLEVVVANM